jgi:hypothetical protein
MKKVTVTRAPVTVTVIGHDLAVRVGRFDPQAAAGRLSVNRPSGTAAVAVRSAWLGRKAPCSVDSGQDVCGSSCSGMIAG